MIKKFFVVLGLISTLSFACPNGDCGDKDCEHHKAKEKKAAAHKHDHEEDSAKFMVKPGHAPAGKAKLDNAPKNKKPTPPSESVDSSKTETE